MKDRASALMLAILILLITVVLALVIALHKTHPCPNDGSTGQLTNTSCKVVK